MRCCFAMNYPARDCAAGTISINIAFLIEAQVPRRRPACPSSPYPGSSFRCCPG